MNDEVLVIALDPDSNLAAHAKREMEFAGVEEDVRPSILAAVQAFASYGHSGSSAAVCAMMLGDLLRFEPLGPLTDDPGEWMHLDADMFGHPSTWQSRRKPSAFSEDHGRHYYVLEEERRWIPWTLRRRLRKAGHLYAVFPRHASARRA
jgi:hypothetical protein